MVPKGHWNNIKILSFWPACVRHKVDGRWLSNSTCPISYYKSKKKYRFILPGWATMRVGLHTGLDAKYFLYQFI